MHTFILHYYNPIQFIEKVCIANCPLLGTGYRSIEQVYADIGMFLYINKRCNLCIIDKYIVDNIFTMINFMCTFYDL